MSLVPFLAVCIAGAFLGLLSLPLPRLARLVGVAALVAAFLTALTIRPGDQLTVGQVDLNTSWYAGLFLSTATASCLILCVLGLAVGWPERLAPAALATFGGLAVAFTATDPGVVLAATAASAVPAILVAIRSRSGPPEIQEAAATHNLDVALAELRTLGLMAVGAVIAGVAVLQPGWTTSDPTFVFALAYAALGLAIAVRFGAVPFHVPAARLSKGRARLGLPLPLVWIPSGIAIVALSWGGGLFQMQGDWLNAAGTGLQVVAVATLILGALGALLHEELEEIAAYSIIQDAAFVLLALAARDADAAEPTRLWLLAFIVAKSALVAWAAALSSTYGSSRLQDLRGWLRRSPVLGLSLVAVVVATLGWPGSAVFEARATLVRLALPSPLHFLGIAAVLLAIAYYGRLIGVGLMAPGELVKSSAGERPRWPGSTSKTVIAVAAATPDPKATARSARIRAARASLKAPSVTAPAVAEAAQQEQAAGRSAAVNHAAGVAVQFVSKASGRLRATSLRSPHAGVALLRQLPGAWRLNRTLETSLLVLAISAISVSIAFGGFGASKAASTGISLDAVVAATPLLPINGNGAPSSGPLPTPSTGPASTRSGSTVSAPPSVAASGPVSSASSGPSAPLGPSPSSRPSSSPSSSASQLTGD